MSLADLPADDPLPRRPGGVIAACERFEAAWNAGRPRRIEDELARPTNRSVPASSASCWHSNSS